MSLLSPEFIHRMNQTFSEVCEKVDHLEMVYAGADRHAAVEWLARIQAGYLPDVTHAGYVAIAAWLDNLDEVVVEAWSGVTSQTGATRDLVFRNTASQMVLVDPEPDDLAGWVYPLTEQCVARARLISSRGYGSQQETKFTPVRTGDERRQSKDEGGPVSEKDRHVVPNPKGGWDVKKTDADRASAHTNTQQEAISRAREIVANTGGETVVHGRRGRIRDKDTSPKGLDPNPPKDKR